MRQFRQQLGRLRGRWFQKALRSKQKHKFITPGMPAQGIDTDQSLLQYNPKNTFPTASPI
jgi:hypothetical protein